MSLSEQITGLVVCLAIAFLAAAVGSFASIHAGDFYQQLQRPAWSPPASVFGPVWSVLYLLMGLASWLAWRANHPETPRALVIYGIQLVLNALWSWLFFAWHQGLWAFVDIVLLWLLIAVTLALFWRIRVLAGALLVPYLLWVTFATALAFTIWRMNPSLLG